MIAPPLPAPLGYVAWGAGVALFAGIVRGFAGFGLSAFIVAGMSLALSPQQIVPAAMMLEILASLSLLRSVWRDVAWHWIGPLLAGYAVAVPLGVWCLAALPEAPLRAAVSVVIFAAALIMLRGWHPHLRDTIALAPRYRPGFRDSSRDCRRSAACSPRRCCSRPRFLARAFARR